MEKIRNFLFKNTSSKQTIAKNTFWLFFGEIVGRMFKLAIVVFATRRLGVEGWGLFSYGLAFVSFFYMLGDIGINTFTTRELSKGTADKYKHVGTSFVLKIALLLALFVASLVLGPHLGKIKLGAGLLMVLSLLYLSDSMREFVLSINRSLEKMEQEAFSKILMNSIITMLGIVLLLKHATPLSLAIAYAVGSTIATLFIAWSIRNEVKKIPWRISKESLQIIYAFSWPIMIISLSSFVFNIDSIMLGQIRSAAEVGLYSAAQRIVQFIAILPAFLAMAVFPVLSKYESDNEKMGLMLEKIMVMIFAIGIPLAIGGFLLKTNIMSLVFGHEYAAGGLTFGILMLSIIAAFPNAILTNVIFSKNLQRVFIIATSVGIAINIGLNFLLIPPYGAVGAALSLVVTQLLIMVINWQKLKTYLSFSVIPKIGMSLLSSLVMTLLILFLKGIGAHLVVVVIAAVIAYLSCLLILKEPTISEIRSLIR